MAYAHKIQNEAQQTLKHLDVRTEHHQIDSLQSLRGIAAIVVLLRHVLSSFPIDYHGWVFVPDLLANSHAAIVTFFVLSGFVLTPSVAKRPLTLPALIHFYIRRAFRTMPLLIIITILSIFYVKSQFSTLVVPSSSDWFKHCIPHNMILDTLDIIKCLICIKSTLVPQNWTLLVEIISSILMPLIIKTIEKGSLYTISMFFIFAETSFIVSGGGGKSLPGVYMIDFVIGIITFNIFHNKCWIAPRWLFLLSLIGLIGTRSTLSTVTGVSTLDFHNSLFSLVEAIFSSIIILSISRNSITSRFLSQKTLVWLGNISFGIYLTHFLILLIVARLARNILLKLSIDEQTLIVFITTFVFSVILSHMIHYTIEVPFNNIGRRLSNNFYSEVNRT